VPPNERSPRSHRGGPANNTDHGPHIITGPCDQSWLVAERAAIKRASDFRTCTWLSLGLRVPDHTHDLVIARAIAQVDRLLRKRAAA
jgi:hypothetical protein